MLDQRPPHRLTERNPLARTEGPGRPFGDISDAPENGVERAPPFHSFVRIGVGRQEAAPE